MRLVDFVYYQLLIHTKIQKQLFCKRAKNYCFFSEEYLFMLTGKEETDTKMFGEKIFNYVDIRIIRSLGSDTRN